MTEIEKKIWPKYFQNILDGKKKFELRLNDFKHEVGDTIVLKEYDPKIKEFTGREIKKLISYIVKTKEADKFWPKEDIKKYGFTIIGFK